MARTNWLDETQQSTLIDEYTEKLSNFMEAMADGHIDSKELADQESRLVKLMKEVEPTLSDAQHEKMTRLLCELTAFNVMQTLHALQQNRPKQTFVG